MRSTYWYLAASTTLILIGIWWSGSSFAQPKPRLEVFRSASCGCCGKWIAHASENGFLVKVSDLSSADLNTLKVKTGIPQNLKSCHTTIVSGYFVEGHVPASEVQRLLTERPRLSGIAVPGMPIGSPGMEISDRSQQYDVIAIDPRGVTTIFSTQKAKD